MMSGQYMAVEYRLASRRPRVDFRIDYRSELNDQQREVVTSPSGGASRVIAGAGSGKTRALIYRVAYLLEQGMSSHEILLLTFTNKAAKEMMGRLAELTRDRSKGIWGGTFHSIGNRFLRQYAESVGYPPRYTIMDRADAKKVVRECVGEAGIAIKKEQFPKPEVLLNILSQAANRMIPIGRTIKAQFRQLEPLMERIEQVFRFYRKRKIEGGLMDFDDLLTLWLELFEKDSEAARKMQQRFRYLLVDEYQDTNRLQNQIINQLVRDHGNLMVVGDDSQSIYSWRGADSGNIIDFEKSYPDSKTFRIEINYRSTPEILRLANEAIRRNRRQVSKTLRPARPSGRKPNVIECLDAEEQAAFIAQRVEELQDEGIPLSEMVVLYRSHSHAIEVEMEFKRSSIPYQILSGVRFFEQAHIKDVLAWLQLVVTPMSELPFKRLANMLPGIGNRSSEKLWGLYAQALESVRGDEGVMQVYPALHQCIGSVPGRGKEAWEIWGQTMKLLERSSMLEDPARMIGCILKRGYREYLQNNFDNYETRLEDVRSMAGYIEQYEDLGAFLEEMALESNLDAEDESGGSGGEDRLRLSTIHQAKGLEFDVVFVIMLCRDMFPSARAESIEEERRLFYVAATRARKELYLSWPEQRFQPGREDFGLTSSQFLDDLPDEVIEPMIIRPGMRSY